VALDSAIYFILFSFSKYYNVTIGCCIVYAGVTV